jgi:hypothetical protein
MTMELKFPPFLLSSLIKNIYCFYTQLELFFIVAWNIMDRAVLIYQMED